MGRHSEHVLAALDLDALERVAFGLRLDNADYLAAGIEQVIHRAGLQRELPYRDPPTCTEVHCLVVLHDPTRSRELAIDIGSGLLFWCHALRFPGRRHPNLSRPGG